MSNTKETYIYPKSARGGRSRRFVLIQKFYERRKNTRDVLKLLGMLFLVAALLLGYDILQ